MTAVTAPSTVTVPMEAQRSRWSRALRHPETVAGITIVAVLFLLGVLAPWIAPYGVDAQSSDSFAGISPAHLLGTDEFGRDVFSRVLYGIRQDVLVTGVAVPIGAVVGTVLGLACGLHRLLDAVIQRIFDVMLAFTALVLGVAVAATAVGPGITAIMVTVVLVNVPLFGRLTRSALQSQRSRDYVVAAEVIGAGRARVIVRHILPNAVDALIVQAALSLSMAVFIEGAMSFVGIGIRPPAPSLGALLRTSVNFLTQNQWYALGPIVVVTALVLGFNLIADGLNRGLLRR
ncbi:ABC transporter permease [Streptomyces sp. MK7]|uniref:ABC transporter permease n=1 Tax=Streptomyces sp. MK7 TaxID=3067635 RepID=UPI0029300D4F|nr:ABC transporter permease [Streptomyces sp. MK7]